VSDSCQCSAEAGSATCELRVLPRGAVVCPTNGKPGKLVETQIVKAMLALPLTEIRNTQYYFCREADCQTVYYSADGAQTFAESDLRERVYQKHIDEDDVFVCYCFRHTPASIREEFHVTGKTTVTYSINLGIKAGKCACDFRNPQGSCCLGNVNSLVKRTQKEMGVNKLNLMFERIIL